MFRGMTTTLRNDALRNGLTVRPHYEGFAAFRADAHGYAVGPTIMVTPRTDGTLWIRVRPRSEWDASLACHVAGADAEMEWSAALSALEAA